MCASSWSLVHTSQTALYVICAQLQHPEFETRDAQGKSNLLWPISGTTVPWFQQNFMRIEVTSPLLSVSSQSTGAVSGDLGGTFCQPCSVNVTIRDVFQNLQGGSGHNERRHSGLFFCESWPGEQGRDRGGPGVHLHGAVLAVSIPGLHADGQG